MSTEENAALETIR
jgi:hypothetical protein